MKSQLIVIKRDGSKEPFDLQKISVVTQAAGLEKNDADLLAERLSVWANSLGRQEVTTLEIRDAVLNELEGVNESIANFFRWYQKTKDIPHPETG